MIFNLYYLFLDSPIRQNILTNTAGIVIMYVIAGMDRQGGQTALISQRYNLMIQVPTNLSLDDVINKILRDDHLINILTQLPPHRLKHNRKFSFMRNKLKKPLFYILGELSCPKPEIHNFKKNTCSLKLVSPTCPCRVAKLRNTYVVCTHVSETTSRQTQATLALQSQIQDQKVTMMISPKQVIMSHLSIFEFDVHLHALLL